MILSFVKLISATFFMAYMYRLLAGPYFGFLEARMEKYQTAIDTLNSPNCQSAEWRVKTNELDNCRDAERIVKRPIYMGAIHDVMNDLAFCKNNECTIGIFNFSNSIPSLILVLGSIAFAIYIALFIAASLSGLRRYTQLNELPISLPSASVPPPNYSYSPAYQHPRIA